LWCRRSQPLALQHQAEQQSGRLHLGHGELVDKLPDAELALRNFATPPFSVTTTGWFSASFSTLEKFFAPRGRPRGLPDWPFLKRVCSGGFL
jgi:hypothetical protein